MTTADFSKYRIFLYLCSIEKFFGRRHFRARKQFLAFIEKTIVSLIPSPECLFLARTVWVPVTPASYFKVDGFFFLFIWYHFLLLYSFLILINCKTTSVPWKILFSGLPVNSSSSLYVAFWFLNKFCTVDGKIIRDSTRIFIFSNINSSFEQTYWFSNYLFICYCYWYRY